MERLYIGDKTYEYEPCSIYPSPSERDVESCIALSFISEFDLNDVLEIGFTLNMHGSITTDVVDKYGPTGDLFHADIRNYTSSRTYKRIISVSTLEHVGWDEIPRELNGLVDSIHNIYNLLSDDGWLWFSVPVGYNLDMDNLFKMNKMPITNLYAIERLSETKWQECSVDAALKHLYCYPIHGANAILIGEVCKNDCRDTRV